MFEIFLSIRFKNIKKMIRFIEINKIGGLDIQVTLSRNTTWKANLI